MIEPFDLVRRYYAAINRRDLDAVLTCYHAEAIGECLLPDDAAATMRRGLPEPREAYVLIDHACTAISGHLAHGSDVDDVTLADPDDWGHTG